MNQEYEQLVNDSLFQDWHKIHPRAFLTHFFLQLGSDLKPKGSWEIGFLGQNKITVFVVGQQVEIKPEDEVFKKPHEQVEKLNLKKVKISFSEAANICWEGLPRNFPGAALGDGFVILQNYKQQLIWNFTFIDKRLKFLNLKIDATTGTVNSHDTIDLVQKS
ncbi:MAG TPA: hypothetical protein VJG49_03445 [Candidatus Nanoarchaeia archaeon]|nr:hypothetical protein [Candidatus Nanoarchaeia archaeon]